MARIPPKPFLRTHQDRAVVAATPSSHCRLAAAARCRQDQSLLEATALPTDSVADAEPTGGTHDMQLIAVDLIDPNPLAPRTVYTPEMIQGLRR